MSDRQCIQDIRNQQTILSLPFGLGWTIDITDTLTALTAAGMPARVEAFDRLRFDDGRTAFLATPDPTTTITDGPSDSFTADVILLPGGSEGGVLSLVRRYPDLVVVNGKRQRVWANGRQVHGASTQRSATPGWRNVFAVARSLTLHGGHADDIATRTGLPVDDVHAALATLGGEILQTPVGWEAANRFALIDWTLAAYPGVGGVQTRWKRDVSIDAQADELIAVGGVLSGPWAAHQYWPEIRPSRLTALFPEHPDMTALGYEPASTDDATVLVIVPQDTTILAPPDVGCCTDEFITAHLIDRDRDAYPHTGWVQILRQLLHFQADTAYDIRQHLPG